MLEARGRAQTNTGSRVGAEIDPSAEVHPTAYLSPGTTVGPRTRVKAWAILGPNVEVGSDCIIATRTEAIVGPAGSEILIGQLVLEALDLIADCRNQKLAPRHPEGPVLATR